MYKITVNKDREYSLERKGDQVTINDQEETLNLIKIKDGTYHLIRNNQSYNIDLIKFDEDEKLMTIQVNGNEYNVDIKDRYDLLLKELGMSNAGSSKIKDLKAPMPGLVLKILVEENQQVQKGDQLLILEAMKMENVLKATGDGTIKSITVKEGDTVEKNQVIIAFG